MTVQQSSTSALPGPVRTAASTLGKVPGAGLVGRVAGGAWHRAGALSPRGRRMAVYAGAGVLGVAGVVEWPVAVTGAAVAWLTRPRPEERRDAGPQGEGAAHGVAGSAAHGAAKTSTTGHGARTGQRKGSATWTTRAAGSARAAGTGPATGAGGTAGTGGTAGAAQDTDTGPGAPRAARSKGTGPAAGAAKNTDTGAADAAKDKDTGPTAGGGAATGTTGGPGTPQDPPAAGARDGTAAPTDGSGSAGSGK
ncbi:hypothetical protein [Streptomyces longwoodensis]|uniref:hypothetical protein n=1 Tax=Streptomyces longwoodensis TaxID=68231 RepID=UPI0033D1A68D